MYIIHSSIWKITLKLNSHLMMTKLSILKVTKLRGNLKVIKQRSEKSFLRMMNLQTSVHCNRFLFNVPGAYAGTI